jgi:hypothetical protein
MPFVFEQPNPDRPEESHRQKPPAELVLAIQRQMEIGRFDVRRRFL